MRVEESLIDGGCSPSTSPCDPSGALKWSEMDLSHVNLNTSWPHLMNPTKNFELSPFPMDPVVNSRVSLWFGDILALQVDGLTQTTNETIDNLPEHIVTRTGQGYLTEIRQQIRSIRTGEARIVSSHHNLPCRDLVLTVTPRFSEKYRTAAETALFSCYKSVLEVRKIERGFKENFFRNTKICFCVRSGIMLNGVFFCLFLVQRACDKNMDCVAIPVLHKGGPAPFPDELGAHVAIRTVRRFLEKGHTSPRLVILAVADPTLFQ